MSGFRRMIDMARSADEIKKEFAPAPMPAEASAPVYPYGLCISLDEDQLDKLDVDPTGCEVGDMIHLAAMAKVTSCSEGQREMADGTIKKCCRIERQITHLGLEDEDRETADIEEREEARSKRARRRYGGDDDGDGLDKSAYDAA